MQRSKRNVRRSSAFAEWIRNFKLRQRGGPALRGAIAVAAAVSAAAGHTVGKSAVYGWRSRRIWPSGEHTAAILRVARQELSSGDIEAHFRGKHVRPRPRERA